jgi:outer membrane protein OmpA-like peptidoglycan-associated protein/Tol biopolymer transport system component
MRIFSLLLSIFISIQLTAQTKQDNIVNEAVDLYGLGQKADAFKALEDCIVKYPAYDRAYFVRANWSVVEKDFAAALPFLIKLEQVNPKFNPLQKKLIAEAYFDQRNLDKAIQYANEFLDFPSLSPDNQIFIKNLIRNIEFVKSQEDEKFTIKYKNLGPEVNSTNGEYFPSTNADESAIYFTRRTRAGEDIWLSYDNEGTWTPSILIDEPELENDRIYTSINTFDNDGAHTISPNGKYLFFTSCQRPGGMGSCDIYFAALKGNEWGKPKLIPAINSKSWESQPCISADGKRLFFVSNREGGYGGSDIYMSELGANSNFSEPKNLGFKLNSIGSEDRPFIHPDGKTLYFSSDGHPGYGGRDLFMSRYENGEWQTPINMGNQINTTGDEISIFINALGDKAYISKQNTENNRTDFDIYTFDLPEKFKPAKVTYIKGIVTNAKTGQPLKASIKLADIEKGEQITSLSSDEKNGDFLMTVTADKEYGFNVIKDGYSIYSQNYSFAANESNTEPQKIEIKLMPLESGTKFQLRNVFFETGKFELKSTSTNELNYIVDILKSNPTLKMQVSGHTDNVGNEANNQLLSDNRAKSVMNYLISKGITADRLSAKGYGSSKPITANDSEEGRAKNRRTEIEIL